MKSRNNECPPYCAVNILVLTTYEHTGAGDLKKYADAIPIYRLQVPHNKSAILLVDVQTSTFHI